MSIITALDRHAPIITKTVTKRPSVPWFNDEVKFAKKEKRRAERKWRRTKLHSDLIDFKAKKNIAICVMKRARTTYYTDLIQGNSEAYVSSLKVQNRCLIKKLT